MIGKFEKYYRERLNVRKSELPKVLRLQLSVFITITLLLLLKSATTSVFLTELGVERLPAAFLIIGFSAIGLNALMQRIYLRFSFLSIIRYSNFIHIGVFTLVSALYFFDLLQNHSTLALYVYMSLFALMVTSLFWQLVNKVYNLREAKRLVAPLGSAAIAGGILGGYLASLLVGPIGNAGIFLLVSLLLVINVGLQTRIWKQYHKKELRPEAGLKMKTTAKLIRNPHIRNIALMVGLGVLIAKLVDYQFNDFATRAIDDPEQLTAFLGFWLSTFNIASLSFQMLFSNRLVDRLGVVRSLMILPVGIAVCSLLLILVPAVWVAILLKGMDGSLKQSVYKTASELVIMPLDNLTKVKAKSFIDIMVDSLATGIAGILLLVALEGMDRMPAYILSTGIALVALIWIYFILKLRQTYYNTYKERLLSNLDFEGTENEEELKLKTEKNLWLPRKLRKYSNYKKLLPYLDHASYRARYLALLRIEKTLKRNSISYIRQHLDDPSVVVRREAASLLVKHVQDPGRIDEIYDNASVRARTSILLALSEIVRESDIKRKRYGLVEKFDEMMQRERIKAMEKSMPESTADVFTAIVKSGTVKYFETIGSYLTGQIEPSLTRQAIKAAGEGNFRMFGAELFQLYFVDQFREQAAMALAKFRNTTVKYASNRMGSWKNEELIQLPYLLSKIPTQYSLDLVVEIFHRDNFAIQSSALRAINSMKSNFDHLNFKSGDAPDIFEEEIKNLEHILTALVHISRRKQVKKKQSRELLGKIQEVAMERLQDTLVSIFICLSLEYDKDDISMAYQNIKGKQEEKKTDALDFLDGILDFQVRKSLLPLLEMAVYKKFTRSDLEKAGLSDPGFSPCLIRLYELKDPELIEYIPAYAVSANNKKLKRLLMIHRIVPREVISRKRIRKALDFPLD